MSLESRRTSFAALTSDPELAITRIEIPHFQRDYAQGRTSNSVQEIREGFLDALFSAIGTEAPSPIGLDFVYGDVDAGTFRPLDGQQRLTTLFLVHWYIASRTGDLAEDHGWKQFSYATRQSARMFCERLVEHPLPDADTTPSEWIVDQPWYLFLWRHDPTVQSMLVMVDAIHDRFREVDAASAWSRLIDPENPAVWFLFQPLSGLGATGGEDMRPEDLYIKMNSRGKPLTEFENFKAHFERTIESSPLAAGFARKVDTTWSDLLWDLRGDDDLIDDEFLRYTEFLTEVCEWRAGLHDGAQRRLAPRTAFVFGEENPDRETHLKFLCDAFDVWSTQSISEFFPHHFATPDEAAAPSKVRLFFRTDAPNPVNLFEVCCRSYGDTRGRARVFSFGQGLVLYAAVVHLIEGTPDFSQRARVLRNLIEASPDELRLENMPAILTDVESVIRHGALENVVTLNQAQVEDEKVKAGFLTEHPHLRAVVFELEDHEYLRGSLGAFELDAAVFQQRAATFTRLMAQPDLWSDLLGALLARGEYQRTPRNARHFLFGTDSKRHDTAWRQLLTGATRERLARTRHVIAGLLDALSTAPDATEAAMETIVGAYLDQCAELAQFDWRYYMVKYPGMRERGSSAYYAEPADGVETLAMGYSLCKLDAGKRMLSSNYRDPYLMAIWHELEDSDAVEDKVYTGYEDRPRRLPLVRSGAALRCVPSGFELSAPDPPTAAFATVCADLGAVDGNVAVPQVDVDGRMIDTVDRIQVGADIVRCLIAAGL